MFILQLAKHQPSEWFEFNETGEMLSRAEIADLSQCPKINPDAQFVVLFPGEDVLMTSVKMPKMSASEKFQAIPFSLEEQLACDPEKIAIALGDAQADSSVVAVFDRDDFESQWNTWREHNLFPHYVVPDFLALVLASETWSVFVRNKIAMIRTDLQNGFSIDADNLFIFLQLALEKNKDQKPKRIICWQENAVIDVAQLEKLGMPIELRDPSRENPLDIKTLASKPALNLLQGKYRPKAQSSLIRKNWMICGVAASALIALVFFGNIAEWIYFRHESNQLQTRITQIYRELFPGATDILEPHFRVQNLLKKFDSESKGGAFLLLYGTTGQTILRFPELQVQSIDYSQHVLSLTLQAKKISTLTQCLQELRTPGFQVTQKITKTEKNHVEATITISGAA